MSEYTTKNYVFFALNNRRDKLSPHGTELMAKKIKEFEKIGKEILAEFDDESVLLKTPIAYHKKLEALRTLIDSL